MRGMAEARSGERSLSEHSCRLSNAHIPMEVEVRSEKKSFSCHLVLKETPLTIQIVESLHCNMVTDLVDTPPPPPHCNFNPNQAGTN